MQIGSVWNMIYPNAYHCVTLLNHMGDDDEIAEDARTSTKEERTRMDSERNHRLVGYLGRNDHWTPFGQQQIKLRIRAPLFIARQWFRHNVGTVRNEMSRRYVSSKPKLFRFLQWRTRPSQGIKQGSGGEASWLRSRVADALFWVATGAATTAYDWLLKLGIAPEQARAVLPTATETIWVETGSLAYWARVYKQRFDKGAQAEVREYAVRVGKIMEELFPVGWKSLTGEEA